MNAAIKTLPLRASSRACPVETKASCFRSAQYRTSVWHLRSLRKTSNLETSLVLLEACGSVKRKSRRLFRACHEHDLVAVDLPCRCDGRLQEPLSVAPPPEGSVSYDILNQSVGPTATRQ